MSSANSEQLKAIEHSGGVLLKAGAGSGKTFVLKEHMIYLTQCWIDEYQKTPAMIDFDQFIKSKFTKIVLMTFTKKAAGEISIRLFNEFNKKATEATQEQVTLWQKACEQLDALTVTTIHGFCFKLIKQGFFTEIDLDEDIIDSAQYDEKITNIFNLWLETELANDEDHEFVDLIIKDRDAIVDSVKSIFGDPSLRKVWSDLETNNLNIESVNESIKQLVQLTKLDRLLDHKVDIRAYNEFENKPWFEFIKRFQQNQREALALEDLVFYHNYFSELNYKIPVTPRAKGVDEELKGYYIAVKELKDFLKSNGPDLAMYFNNYDSMVMGWFNRFYSLIKFVDKHYSNFPGITFSDLEYLVSRGLENSQVAKAISETYDYLIIDEFQDTSFIQFDIVSRIIQNDYKRLFCVGDIKQAIYGFRGGELGVFLNCEKLVPKVMSLKNNYRSDQNIVEFNNNFFDFLFSKGLKYQGEDIRPVEVEYQEVPLKERDLGKVYQLNTNCEFLEQHNITKLSGNEVDYIEALSLYKNIIRLKKEDPKQIAILYKKLKPSLLLIGLLIEHNIGFTAQVKIPFGQDPILGMFTSLLEYEFNTNELKSNYLRLVLRSYLALIDSTLEVDLDKAINKFQKNENYFGLYSAFYHFLMDLKIANSNFKNNLSFLKTVCKLGKDDKERILSIIYSEQSNSYSLDFQYGENASDIVMMTAHASKGLQFSHVLLGGIYTNDKSFPNSSILGKFPMSFKWGETLTSKQKFKTPDYILENIVTKHKEFSESKRLFYVACTRAENTIGWVNINFGKIKKTTQSGSWSNGINTWLSQTFKTSDEILRKIQENSINLDIESSFSFSFLENTSQKIPLFHIDNLGINIKEDKVPIYVLPELSVTRLATLSECPRKFYLQNICKLSDNDLKLLQGEKVILENVDENELSAKSFSSSAQRGTRIHDQIDQIIKNQFKLPDDLNQRDKDSITWAVDKLKTFRDNYDFVSEKMIKFELYDYMISGIPDLLLFPAKDEQVAQVWDYKTGKRSDLKEKSYTYQLMAYAYALYTLHDYDKQKPINLVLCYLDQKQLVEQKVFFLDVDKYLSEYWQKVNTPSETCEQFCPSCIYNNICRK